MTIGDAGGQQHPRAAAGMHVAATPAPAAPDTDRNVDTSTDTRHDLPWDVIVWDDPVTLMSYVVWVFKKVLGVGEAVATKLMLEVHNAGRALVASQPREQAEFTLQRLHAHGLQATIQQAR